MSIKAIETQYKGYRFRSRLEARWAVFFDALKQDWEYEREGFELGDGVRYLPDFWLFMNKPYGQEGFWIEIKPSEPDEHERLKLELLCAATNKNVFCFWGSPYFSEWHATYYSRKHKTCRVIDAQYDHGEIAFESLYSTVYVPLNYSFHCLPITEKKSRLELAFQKARSAHFEFGEEG